MHTHPYTYIIDKMVHKFTYMQTCSCIHTHSHIHTHTYAHKRTHMCVYIYFFFKQTHIHTLDIYFDTTS